MGRGFAYLLLHVCVNLWAAPAPLPTPPPSTSPHCYDHTDHSRCGDADSSRVESTVSSYNDSLWAEPAPNPSPTISSTPSDTLWTNQTPSPKACTPPFHCDLSPIKFNPSSPSFTPTRSKHHPIIKISDFRHKAKMSKPILDNRQF